MITDKYNNIFFSMVVLIAIIKEYKKIELSKVFLILPIVFNKKLLNKLSDGRIKVKSINSLKFNNIDLLIDFNDRFYNSLEYTMNALILAKKLNFLKIKDGFIFPNKEEIIKLDFNKMGKRVEKVLKSSKNINKILNEDVKYLYLFLRIKL